MLVGVWRKILVVEQLDVRSELEFSETNEYWGQSPWLELIATIIWKVRYHSKVDIDLLSLSVVVKIENILKEFVDLHVRFFQVIGDHEVCNCFTTISVIIPRMDYNNHNYRTVLIEEAILGHDLIDTVKENEVKRIETKITRHALRI